MKTNISATAQKKPRHLVMLVLLLTTPLSLWAEDQAAPKSFGPPTIGPATEKRFPPMTLPKGFKAKLFACDPLVEYPSVIALGPKLGTLFVAHDYVTGLGIKIVRRDEIRLLQDSDGDGYADKSVVFAGGFNSIQGLAYHAGAVYVMHAPRLTMVRDTDGDNVADQRRDLLVGFGLRPEDNPNRLHCANGVVVGHDGWLYLALGDRGCDVKRPEGDRLIFREGGILRCRFDGSDLHVFSTGLRNIYDIALDADLNVFVRDNENDGGDYMIRVCHCFFGSDHGYPYLYYERPDEAMLPLADLGRGSSAGGTSYLETAYPKDYRKSLFFCEWGRAVVRYECENYGSSFAAMKEVDFMAGAANDPYGFKPTDLVVDWDGSLLISDWADGQRPKRGRARIYRVTHATDSSDKRQVDQESAASVQLESDSVEKLIGRLNSGSYYRRVAAQEEIQRRGKSSVAKLNQAIRTQTLNQVGRLHSVWILAHFGGKPAVDDLFAIAKSDPEPRVKAQAIKAIGDLVDPILVKDRIEAGRGDVRIAQRLGKLAGTSADPRVMLSVMSVLGRLRWEDSPHWLQETSRATDPALTHATIQLLRNSDNWNAVVQLLDGKPGPRSLRRLALLAIADREVPHIADQLIHRLQKDQIAKNRSDYADALTRIWRKPAPWTYWGFRPVPRPADSVDWERTKQIELALVSALADKNHDVRSHVLQRMLEKSVPVPLIALSNWLHSESSPKHVATILDALQVRPAVEVRQLLAGIVTKSSRSEQMRIRSLGLLIKELGPKDEKLLIDIAQQLRDDAVLAATLEEFGRRPKLPVDELLLARVDSRSSQVRAAAIRSLGKRKTTAGRKHVATLLEDADMGVRLAAAEAAGLLGATDVVDQLVSLVETPDPQLRRTALTSLQQLNDPRSVAAAVASLKQPETQLAALAYLKQFGDARYIEPATELARTNLAIETQTAVVQTLAAWLNRSKAASDEGRRLQNAIAKVQAQSGTLLNWTVIGPLTSERANNLVRRVTHTKDLAQLQELATAKTTMATGTNSEVRLPLRKQPGVSEWFAATSIHCSSDQEIEVLSSSSGALEIWFDNRSVYRRTKTGPYRLDSDRFEAKMSAGTHRITVRVSSASGAARFHVRFRVRSSKADHERLIRMALNERGNVRRGEEVFLKAEKSLCVKCHRIGTEGSRIGPDLAGIGSRFSRIHLIESVLQPSRTVAPSYGTVSVTLADGSVVSGVKISETKEELVLGDTQGKTQKIKKSEIEERQLRSQSTMPEGVEKRLTDREFVDLIAFLTSLKKR